MIYRMGRMKTEIQWYYHYQLFPCSFSWRTVWLCLSSIEERPRVIVFGNKPPLSPLIPNPSHPNGPRRMMRMLCSWFVHCPPPGSLLVLRIPRCKSSIRTFSRHPNCRNCGWRLSIDHRVTPGPGALPRLYPAPARGNHTTGDRSAHATSLSPFQVCNFKLHSQSIPNNFLVSQSIPDHKNKQTFLLSSTAPKWHCHWLRDRVDIFPAASE